MKYADVANYPRAWKKASHPVVAHIEIPAEDLAKFESLSADNADVRFLGHDPGDSDFVIVHVACASEDVRNRLEEAWT